MKIERTDFSLRIWLDNKHCIYKHKDLFLYHLEYYRFGLDHMPDDIYADDDLLKVYDKYMEVK